MSLEAKVLMVPLDLMENLEKLDQKDQRFIISISVPNDILINVHIGTNRTTWL